MPTVLSAKNHIRRHSNFEQNVVYFSLKHPSARCTAWHQAPYRRRGQRTASVWMVTCNLSKACGNLPEPIRRRHATGTCPHRGDNQLQAQKCMLCFPSIGRWWGCHAGSDSCLIKFYFYATLNIFNSANKWPISIILLVEHSHWRLKLESIAEICHVASCGLARGHLELVQRKLKEQTTYPYPI